MRGVSAVGLAVAAGTLTSAAVFLPIIFGKQDQISIFLTHVATAIVVSLAISLFIAQTVIPLAASRLDRPSSKRQNASIDFLREKYVRLLNWNMRHRWLAAGMVILTLLSAAIPMSFVETDMFPQDDTRRLYMPYHLDGHYPLAKLKESVDRIEEYLYANQERLEIRAVYSYYSEQAEGTASTILLTDDKHSKRSSQEISSEILENMPKIAIGRPSFDFQRVGGGEKLSVTLTGTSSEVLRDLSEDVVRILSSVEGLTGVVSAVSAGDQEVQVRVNRERANQLGFSTQEVAQVVAIAIRGVDLREFKGEEGEIPVRLQFREQDRQQLDDLRDIKLRNSEGVSIPLMSMVDFIESTGPTEIRRLDRKTGLSITAQLDGITTEKAMELIKENMELMSMPSGYGWHFGGGFTGDQEAMQKMLFNILLAIAIIYIVLAAQFESLVYPLSMICTILFSVIGVYWFFLLTGTTFTLMAMIGILILIGVVVNNGIVLIDHVNQLRLQGLTRDEALIRACRERMRPDPDDGWNHRAGFDAAVYRHHPDRRRRPALLPDGACHCRRFTVLHLCQPGVVADDLYLAGCDPALAAQVVQLARPAPACPAQAAAKACSRSAMISSISSIPIHRRIMSGVTPAASSSAPANWRCVVDAGWAASDFTSPMLTRRRNICSAS